METTINTYFGKGEYAVTSKNIEKLEKAVNHFNATGEWKWCLVDCLGIREDGKFGKRYEEVKKAIKDIPECQGLYSAMESVVEKDASEITRNRRPNKSDKHISDLHKIAEEMPAHTLLTELVGEEAAGEVLAALTA